MLCCVAFGLVGAVPGARCGNWSRLLRFDGLRVHAANGTPFIHRVGHGKVDRRVISTTTCDDPTTTAGPGSLVWQVRRASARPDTKPSHATAGFRVRLANVFSSGWDGGGTSAGAVRLSRAECARYCNVDWRLARHVRCAGLQRSVGPADWPLQKPSPWAVKDSSAGLPFGDTLWGA